MIVKKKRKRIVFLLVSASLLTNHATNSEIVEANFEGYSPNCVDNADGTASGNGDVSNVQGDWGQEGTTAHKNAKKIWDFWIGKGFGGVHASGVLGNIDHEGGFAIPDRPEGYYGDDIVEGVASGVVPKTGVGYDVGGGGHYQFTPYTKFAPLGDSKWLDSIAQSEFVWESEVKNASWLGKYIKLTTPEQASEMWSAKYERPAKYDPKKSDSARKAYQVFGGANIPPSSSIGDSEGTANKGENEAKQADLCDYNSDASKANSDDIVEDALSLLGYFTYLQVHGEKHIGSAENPDKNGVTDCSGFVWLVLKRTGYSVPENMAWYTKTMADDANGDQKWLKKIPASEAVAGDVVIVNTGNGAGSNGHTAILTEAWISGQSDSTNPTKIVQMGGGGTGVNEGNFNTSFGSLVKGDYSIVFARAVKGDGEGEK